MKYDLVETFQEPGLAYWASYLINGDASGLDDREIAACDAWLARIQPSEAGQHASISDCGESYTARFDGLLSDVCDYTLIVYQEVK